MDIYQANEKLIIYTCNICHYKTWSYNFPKEIIYTHCCQCSIIYNIHNYHCCICKEIYYNESVSCKSLCKEKK